MASKIIIGSYLEEYKKKQRFTILKHFNEVKKKSTHYSFAFINSSIYSSLLEGSTIDLENYRFNKETDYKSPEMNRIDDLIATYRFAKTHKLNKKNILQAHLLLSNSFEIANRYKGVFRDRDVRIGNSKITVYSAVPVAELENELLLFFKELSDLLTRKNYTYTEAFYYASMVHLAFVNIHPFADGNGRMARLIEKWFLASILGDQSWNIPSETNYWVKRDKYYSNLRMLGSKYEKLDYSKSIPFLLMLPSSFGISKRYAK